MNNLTPPHDQALHCVEEIAAFLRRNAGAEGVDETLAALSLQAKLPAPVAPRQQKVAKHMNIAIDKAGAEFAALVSHLGGLQTLLCWMQNPKYTDAIMGEGFTQNYAWAELIGTTGPLTSHDFILGFLMLGPNQHYIDHWHKAPELYVPLTGGTLWRKGDGEFVERKSGEIIWHPSMIHHAMKTGTEPLLAVYAWTRDTDCEIFLPEEETAAL